MSYRKAKNAGFTLVEILIVVVILGILAAIVIPQFTNASQAAKASQLTAQLQTIRSQLELAQIEHQGVYPTLKGAKETGWAPLLIESQRVSGYDATTDNSTTKAGPYLQKPPVNPFFAGADGTLVGENPESDAWFYDVATGFIAANATDLDTTQAEDLGLDVIKGTGERGDVFTTDNKPAKPVF